MKDLQRLVAQGDLSSAVRKLMLERGLEPEHADFVVNTLVSTSLNGIDTHGVELLPIYVKELTNGRSLSRPNITIASPRPAISIVDADDALGVVAGNIGMKIAITTAKSVGASAALVKNSNHFGAAGYYAALAATDGMIGLAFSNADALVAPHLGVQPVSGTNPVAMAAPSADGHHFLLDIATSQVSYSQVRQCMSEGTATELGWAIDHNGFDTAVSGQLSALKPLGGYKGQGLALLVQIVTALLAGTPFDHQLSNLFDGSFERPRKIAHLFMCLDIDIFVSQTVFMQRLAELLAFHRSSRAQEGHEIHVPGDKEKAIRNDREVRGIPVSHELLALLAL
jgi:LDH2 family malate/lactate/ureidoglycolate dehydrogenase